MQNMKLLQTIYNFLAALGFISVLFGTFFVSIMSTDSPNHTAATPFFSGLIAFIILFTIGVGLPMAAHREIEVFQQKRKFIYNIISAIVMLFIFFPIALVQAYLIYDIYTNPTNNRENVESDITTKGDIVSDHKTEDFDEYVETRLKELDKALEHSTK